METSSSSSDQGQAHIGTTIKSHKHLRAMVISGTPKYLSFTWPCDWSLNQGPTNWIPDTNTLSQ
ncbi:CLUMA_CG000340, isoform A [Clunio marinus]|uniref:CLUMA_CG000340, isoform A n=1 Tax=Clunio marinus TaxID=568069 RepID=A0A1J1HGL5_9DIPT|nr:CLUMA_CG000340, isoform A [Clunio marinus]